MKNIHVLPTDKLSRLISCGKEFTLLKKVTVDKRCKHIYITSDEEIKEGDWFYNPKFNEIGINYNPDSCKKIILTTDQDLIKNGVQAIDDEFLEWFVKNSSCEFVRIENTCLEIRICDCPMNGDCLKPGYKIIISQEEPKQTVEEYEQQGMKKYSYEMKQETLEEAAEKYVRNESDAALRLISKYSFKDGAKWQAELQSAEDVTEITIDIAIKFAEWCNKPDSKDVRQSNVVYVPSNNFYWYNHKKYTPEELFKEFINNYCGK